MRLLVLQIMIFVGLLRPVFACGQADSVSVTVIEAADIAARPEELELDTALCGSLPSDAYKRLSLYALPYSGRMSHPEWGRLWGNTALLSGAFVGTLAVLECLPEDATSWNRAALQEVPLFKRWREHVIELGPEWDHDNFVFNYVLHPYAGAVYFMAARSCGFSYWGSLLYATCISTIGWEFGIEAFMERPSIQDLFITPVVGSAIGELFYLAKRRIVANDYCLLGSKFLGGLVCFLIDPVNEALDLLRGSQTRALHLRRGKCAAVQSHLMPTLVGGAPGVALSVVF